MTIFKAGTEYCEVQSQVRKGAVLDSATVQLDQRSFAILKKLSNNLLNH